ncbi:hypothetical protein CDAR_405361 [Caerostris darwini]|uniref:Uncharacterized protein n=1 Tax=Caerostris darwini TaxID=1538125 RepID=A0AAV4WHR5_9ARAC|nr:hypothetical protein CDAR_405361 [Caerostris darwini]
MLTATPSLFSGKGHSANGDGVLRCRKSFSQKGDERGSEDSSCPEISDSEEFFFFTCATKSWENGFERFCR